MVVNKKRKNLTIREVESEVVRDIMLIFNGTKKLDYFRGNYRNLIYSELKEINYWYNRLQTQSLRIENVPEEYRSLIVEIYGDNNPNWLSNFRIVKNELGMTDLSERDYLYAIPMEEVEAEIELEEIPQLFVWEEYYKDNSNFRKPVYVDIDLNNYISVQGQTFEELESMTPAHRRTLGINPYSLKYLTGQIWELFDKHKGDVKLVKADALKLSAKLIKTHTTLTGLIARVGKTWITRSNLSPHAEKIAKSRKHNYEVCFFYSKVERIKKEYERTIKDLIDKLKERKKGKKKKK